MAAVSMAKLSSSSCCCRPLLLQGMMLLALLLLASIQAGPVMAQEQSLLKGLARGAGKELAGVGKELVDRVRGGAGGTFPRTSPWSKAGVNHVGEEPAFVVTQGAVDEEAVELVDLGQQKLGAVFKKVLSTSLDMLCKKPTWTRFCNGAKKGIKVRKYLCKAQGWMHKVIPDDVRFLAIDIDMSSFPVSFRYRGDIVVCSQSDPWVFKFPAAGP